MRKGLPVILIAALSLPVAAAAAPAGKARTGELAFQLDMNRPGALDNLIAARLKPLTPVHPAVVIVSPDGSPAKQGREPVFSRILKNYSSGVIKADATTRAAAKRVISTEKK